MLALLLTLVDDPLVCKPLEYIIKKYTSEMKNVAYGVLGNISDAEDAVEDVWVELAFNVDKIPDFYEPSKRTRSYLRTAAKYSAIDYLRNKINSPKTVPIDGIDYEEYLRKEQTEEFTEESHRIYEEAIKVISKMPMEYRRVISLIYIYGKTYDEVSEILNIPVGTVKSRQSRALKILREHFDCKKTER